MKKTKILLVFLMITVSIVFSGSVSYTPTTEEAKEYTLQAAGDLNLFEKNGEEYIYVFRTMGEEYYPDAFLEDLEDDEKTIKLPWKEISFNLRKNVTSLMLLPREFQSGETYDIYFLIGSIFNPKNGLLKSLTPFTRDIEEFLNNPKDNDRQEIKLDKPNPMSYLNVKLVVPEDKIRIQYDEIEIMELWSEAANLSKNLQKVRKTEENEWYIDLLNKSIDKFNTLKNTAEGMFKESKKPLQELYDQLKQQHLRYTKEKEKRIPENTKISQITTIRKGQDLTLIS